MILCQLQATPSHWLLQTTSTFLAASPDPNIRPTHHYFNVFSSPMCSTLLHAIAQSHYPQYRKLMNPYVLIPHIQRGTTWLGFCNNVWHATNWLFLHMKSELTDNDRLSKKNFLVRCTKTDWLATNNLVVIVAKDEVYLGTSHAMGHWIEDPPTPPNVVINTIRLQDKLIFKNVTRDTCGGEHINYYKPPQFWRTSQSLTVHVL